MQSLDRFLDAGMGGRPFQPFQPFVQCYYIVTKLVEGLGLLTGRDVHFLCRARQDPARLAMAAFAGVYPPRKPSQLVFDPPPGLIRFSLAAADPRHHLFGIAAAGCRGGQAPAVQIGAGRATAVNGHTGLLVHA